MLVLLICLCRSIEDAQLFEQQFRLLHCNSSNTFDPDLVFQKLIINSAAFPVFVKVTYNKNLSVVNISVLTCHNFEKNGHVVNFLLLQLRSSKRNCSSCSETEEIVSRLPDEELVTSKSAIFNNTSLC